MPRIDFKEVGYTPANLRLLIEAMGITQSFFAELMGEKNVRTIRQWLNTDLHSKSHCDMPHLKWLKAVSLLNNRG